MAQVRLDRMLVLDVEETCWDGGPPPGERTEIIQIGIAELLLDGIPGIGRMASFAVRPMASRISPFCTELTGITPKAARSGMPLREVVGTVRKEFGGAGKIWAAWGRDDESLSRDCVAAGIEPLPFGGFLDLGALWTMLSGSARSVGLQQALGDLGLVFEGTPHRALDDAVNTARVAASLADLLRARLALCPLEDGRSSGEASPPRCAW